MAQDGVACCTAGATRSAGEPWKARVAAALKVRQNAGQIVGFTTLDSYPAHNATAVPSHCALSLLHPIPCPLRTSLGLSFPAACKRRPPVRSPDHNHTSRCMAYYDHHSRYHQPMRHDSYYSRSRDANGYSRHANLPLNSLDGKLTAMSNSVNQSGYSYDSYDPRYAARAVPPPLPKRSSAQPSYRSDTRKRYRWPPSPSVEDEKTSLAREFPSAGSGQEESSGEAKSRGSVDQYPIIEEIEQPLDTTNDRRFVLISDPSADADSNSTSNAARERRRKSIAERGNMPHLKTDIDDPPLFTKRTSTPYAYTKPQKESIAPSIGEYFLSPESITPSTSSVPRSVPKQQEAWDTQRDQNVKPPRAVPTHSRYDSFTQSPRAPKNDVFDDSDTDDATHLQTERKPARYSFVKSDLQKEDLRTNLLDNQTKSDKRRSNPPVSQPNARGGYESSSGSSKNPSPGSQSPRSSTASLNENGLPSGQKARPSPIETSYVIPSNKYSEARPSRPASPLRSSPPLHREAPPSPPRSPRLPPRRPTEQYSGSRPSSRAGTSRPPSPLSSSTTNSATSPRVPVTEADWHATYPPTTASERSRPLARFSRHESMPVPMPRIDVQSPSPARPPRAENPLPYPVDDRPADVFMPPEEAYQFDHSSTPVSSTPRQSYPESPKLPKSPIPGSPRSASTFDRPSPTTRHTASPEDLRRTRVRSNSTRSQSSYDGRRSGRTLSLDRPMPSCPRSEASAKYNDWFTLESCPNFDICPSCYNGVFADTLFADYFKPIRRYDDRLCDFSSPWMRLAWLLTIKQQRKTPDLIYNLATIADVERPCPKDIEISGGTWYGIPDQRDGIHVANFAVCPCDRKMVEALCPTLRGYLTVLPTTSQYGSPRQKYTCALRATSRRFPTYLDLLVELDEESRLSGRAPDIDRFVKLAREHAFKSECAKDKAFTRRPWHYIPQLPEFTICEECFDEHVWPAIVKKNAVAKLFNRTTQLVSSEDIEGTSCCLYSPRMKRVLNRALEDEDYPYLRRKAIDRKRAETRLAREKADLNRWLETMSKSGGYRESEFEKLRRELRAVEDEWKSWE